MVGLALSKTYASSVENPTPIDSPNNECIIRASEHASRGLGGLFARISLPNAGVKNKQRTDTLAIPKKRPLTMFDLRFLNLTSIKNT